MSNVAESTSENEPELNEPPDIEQQVRPKEEKPLNTSPGAVKLRSWLNKSLRIEMFDGRVLIGVFLCTDRDANVILGSCTEYLPVEENAEAQTEEPRMLGLVMVPGKHIKTVSILEDDNNYASAPDFAWAPLSKYENNDIT